MTTLTRESPAKINLTLRVLGTLPDGFHELESLIAQIDFCDTVTVAQHEDGCYSLECDDPTLPRDGSNLVLQVAKALNKVAGTNHGVEITLAKRIPSGSGLGGGSSNAATTLALLNELWETKLPPADLAQLGATLGSDIPLFFHSSPCLVRGRGEQIDDVHHPIAAWVTLILPNLHCATPAVYAAWDRLRQHPQQPPLADILAAAKSPARLMTVLFNDLERAAFEVVPELRHLAAQAAELAKGPVRMTGSGSALFRLFEDEPTAARFAGVASDKLSLRTVVAKLRTT
jgi:4-diphosphocytidyl-2-C-methyl-D-erythritol kinase